jgi:fructose-1-phosphate kinase PfkB-like protein
MVLDVLAVNANPLLNLIHAGGFVPGAINRAPALSIAAEGKGANVARMLVRHGHRVALAGFAGGHSGAWLRDLIRAEGVADACVETAAPLRVGFMAAGFDADHPTTVLPCGFPVTAAECQALLARIDALLGSARLVIASGSTPHPAADDLYLELLALCARRGVPCWLDAYGPAMGRALAGPHPPALAKPNREELADFDWERVEELHITDGDRPIDIRCRREGRWRVTPPDIRQVNPIGSGDCYVAGLAHGWLLGWPWPARLRYAAGAGAANALRHDVATALPEEAEALAQRAIAARV